MSSQFLTRGTRGISTASRCSVCENTISTRLLGNRVHSLVCRLRHLLKAGFQARQRARHVLEEQIHEDLIQPLVGALLRLEAVRHLGHSNPDRAATELDRAAELLEECIERARRIAGCLRLPLLQEIQLNKFPQNGISVPSNGRP